MRFPTQHVSVAVFCNVSTASADQLSLQIADIVLEDALLPRDASPLTASEVRVDPDVFDSYVGQYSVPDDNGSYALTVSRDNDRYFVQRPGTPPIEMFPDSDSEFFVRVSSARFVFHRSTPGTVTRVSIEQPSGTKEGVRISAFPVPPESTLQQLAGRYYSDELQVAYDLDVSEGQLIASGPAGLRLPLEAHAEDQFTFPGDGEIKFSRDGGNATPRIIYGSRPRYRIHEDKLT